MILVGIDIIKDNMIVYPYTGWRGALGNHLPSPIQSQEFDLLYERICATGEDFDNIKVGLEATGHYSYNILGYLLDKGLPTFVINPLHANLYRKSLSLRKTKTDKVDCTIIAGMLMSDVDLKPYSRALYHSTELKSLTRYRLTKSSSGQN